MGNCMSYAVQDHSQDDSYQSRYSHTRGVAYKKFEGENPTPASGAQPYEEEAPSESEPPVEVATYLSDAATAMKELSSGLDWSDEGGVPEDWELRSLKDEASYHWEMVTQEAEKTLKSTRQARCHIIWYSKMERGFKLSVKGVRLKRKRIEHYLIKIEQNGERNMYSLRGEDVKFGKLSELLQHYQRNRISRKLKTIGVPVVSKYYTGGGGGAIEEPQQLRTQEGAEQDESSGDEGSDEERNPKPQAAAEKPNDKGDTGVEVRVQVHAEVQPTEQGAEAFRDAPQSHGMGASGNADEVGITESTDGPSAGQEEVIKKPSPPESKEDTSYPQLHLLILLTWRDGKGKEHKLEILKALKRKWQKVGQLLGLSPRELERFKKEENKKIGRCRRIFSHWIDSKGYPPKYPLTWEGLEKILRDLKQKRTANNLNNALVSLGNKPQ